MLYIFFQIASRSCTGYQKL